MTDTAIDGDIADFIDAKNYAGQYRTEDLRDYLLREGHDEAAVVAAVRSWQQERFWQIGHQWQSFGLTPAGRAAVQRLRDRNLNP